MIRSCLVFPSVGLVRCTNCPIKQKEYIREAIIKRNSIAYHWQLEETVKNIRRYKCKEGYRNYILDKILDQNRMYDGYVRGEILEYITIEVPHIFWTNTPLPPDNYSCFMKFEIMFGRLKDLGYSDIIPDLKSLTDFDVEISYVNSIFQMNKEMCEFSRHLHSVLKVKNKWRVILSHVVDINYYTLQEFLCVFPKMTRMDLYYHYSMRFLNISLEEVILFRYWWSRIKYSNKME